MHPPIQMYYKELESYANYGCTIPEIVLLTGELCTPGAEHFWLRKRAHIGCTPPKIVHKAVKMCATLRALLRVQRAPGAYISAAGCTAFETCAPGVCMLLQNCKYVYIVSDTLLNGRVHYFGGLCTWQVRKIKP